MRILQVIHQFPPFSSQGSEVYCANVSVALRRSSDTRVFHISNPPRGWKRGLYRSTYAGVPTYHCVDGGAYARVADWPNRRLRTAFGDVLDEVQPDIVHFHNYISLGDDLVTMARRSGAAVVYTLHDYGLICPNALLLRDDGRLCDKQHGDFFQDCCPLLIRTTGGPRDTAPWYATMPSLTRWGMFARQQPGRTARVVLGTATGAAARWLGEPRTTNVDAKREFFLQHTRRIFEDADVFIAPSRFLLERYASCGIPRHKLRYARYGMAPIATVPPRPRSGPVRIGYIGALHPQKGIELLLDAFRHMRGDAALHVHGSVFGSPISDSYRRRMRERAAPNIFFHGAYDNTRVSEILADLDVVVVPSIWYENSPLTIQEAFMAGVPVITANVGGMAELVEDGTSGLLFRTGDADSLRSVLQRVVDDPDLLPRLREGIPAVMDLHEHTAELLALYAGLASR